MKKLHMRFIVGILLLATIITGCGTKIPDAPALLEPLAANESFRPVEYGDIGLNAKLSGVAMGVVSPEEYCHFFLTTVRISEMSVSVGDYVSEGDVLAVADIEWVQKMIDDANRQLANLTSCHEAEENIYSLTRKKLEYERTAFAESGDVTQATAKEAEIGILDENRRYNNMLYEHRVSDIREDISKKQEIISDGTLKAKVSGRVVYCKDLSEGRNATVDENVVVVADFDDCHIEVADMQMLRAELGALDEDISPSKYNAIYTVQNGEKKYLDEYAYSKSEQIVIENKKSEMPVRFCYADGTKPENVGETVPIFYLRQGKEDVLRIEMDSMFEDGDGNYVYVKTENGKEKRYVELGSADKCYREVVSGLSEGELVYYSVEQVMPDKYDEYTVNIQNYEEKNTIQKYNIETTIAAAYYSEYEGVFLGSRLNAGDYVNAGDVVCEIKTDQGNAMLTEMKNSIDKLSSQHTAAIKSYDEQIAIVDSQIYELDYHVEQTVSENETATSSDAATATPGDAEEEYVNPYARDILACERDIIQWQKKLETINYEYQLSGLNEEYEKTSKGNDGNGNISVYANSSGTITEVFGGNGRNIQAGTKLFSINTPSSPRVSIVGPNSLSVGQKVTFKDDKGKTYYGETTSVGADGKNYVTTVNDKVYITTNISTKNKGKCYISMEDKSFYELDAESAKMNIEYSLRIIPGCVVLPGKGFVYEETISGSAEVRYYVWKIVDDTLVKKYVTLGSQIGGKEICVIEGLSEGDILAGEPLTKEMEE